ncbi:hypothetical protein LOC67_25180 [Stieleria sp. JC731]|uniref:hypothetical protein n=1 Tax=Pirellulaceae TaxID=2691357 RepID=UPI001E42A6EC|nr:hypothetical protein [Stieleria sp. JC731]MCC9603858.1 hypothetical protein [Stieleria sp. JC731]
MIAEKTVQSTPSPAQRIGDAELPAVKEESQVDEAVMLENLAAEIRQDATDQALFYLIRSNTGYDGE